MGRLDGETDGAIFAGATFRSAGTDEMPRAGIAHLALLGEPAGARRHAGFPPEEAVEISGIGKSKTLCDHLYAGDGEDQFLLGDLDLALGNQPLQAEPGNRTDKPFETGWHDDGDRRADRLNAAIQQGITLAAKNVQDLQKSRMAMQADFKAMQAAPRKKRLAMEAKIAALRGFLTI